MGRLFITHREIDFISDITKELIKDIIGQNVFYYAINEEKTKINELYKESNQKIFDPPIDIEVLVEFSGQIEIKTDKFGHDTIWGIKTFFHNKDLIDKNIIIREGDFVGYGERFYEIVKLERPTDIYGQNENIHGIHATCRLARQGQFNTETIPQKVPFVQSRGRAGDNTAHDKRALQDGNSPKIDVTNDKFTTVSS